MHEDTAERIAAGAPGTMREAFLRSALPGLGAALDTVRKNPARIKRYNARQARRIVALLDDPEQLSQVREQERRATVREAVSSNPAVRRGPHERNCVLCQRMPTIEHHGHEHLAVLLADRKAREDAFGTTNLCEEQVIRTISGLPANEQDTLWEVAFRHTLRHSARAHVEAAAGRIHRPAAALDWGGHSNSALRTLLVAEETATPALLYLAAAVKHIPDHWKLTEDDWRNLLTDEPERVVESTHRIPVTVLVETWHRLPSAARLTSLLHAGSADELERLLPLLSHEDVAWSQQSDRHGEKLVGLLHRFPDLDETRRLGILGLLPRRLVGEHLLGRLGIGMRPDEVGDVFSLYGLGQAKRTYRVLIEQAGRAETPFENRMVRNTLIEALVRNAPPGELFLGENRVSAAAHDFVWRNLSGDAAVGSFASLLEEWTGTLPELVDAANELAR